MNRYLERSRVARMLKVEIREADAARSVAAAAADDRGARFDPADAVPGAAARRLSGLVALSSAP